MASSNKFKEKLGHLSSELEDLKLLRSLSPYVHSGRHSRSSRHLSHSPRPHKPVEVAPPPPPPPQLDSRPDIAAWPAPPTTGSTATASTSTKQPPVKSPSQQQQPQPQSQPHPLANISLSISPAPSVHSSLAPVHHGSSPFPSPRPSPLPPASPRSPPPSHHGPPSLLGDLCDDSSKLLSMLKVVAASSAPSVRGRESELRQKIQALEETVAEYERQKYSVLGTFSEYRERVVERERHLEAEYSNKIITLSEEVLGAKKEFEARMKSFQALQEKFEREKEQALEKLREEHQKEIHVLEQRFSESQLLNLEQNNKKLAEITLRYIIEIQRLEEERKSLRAEKDRLGENFEVKLRRAQSLYETELTAAKMLYTRELEALRDHEEALKEELVARQEEFHDRLHEIQSQAKQSRDEMNNCKNEVAQLEQKLKQKELEVQNIANELSAARSETNEAIRKLNSAKEESRQKYVDQKAELDRKSKMLNEAETTKNKLEYTIRDLQTEVKGLRNKVDFLEMERDNLQSQSESQSKLHNSQVQALEAVLESVTREKDSTKDHYEKLLEREREQAEEREYSIKKEFSAKLNELEDQYNALREHIEQGDSFGPENVKLWEEIEVLRSEKTVLEEEVGGLRRQLSIGGDHSLMGQEKEDDASLNHIIEMLRAIDMVKRKVLRGGSFSTTTTSSRDSENRDEPATKSEKREAGVETVLDVKVEELKKELKSGTKTTEFPTLIKRLEELTTSLDTIIAEKNAATHKVEQLSEENKILLEKLEHLSAASGGSQSHHLGSFSEGEGVGDFLETYRRRIDELELQSRQSRKQSEEETQALEESYTKLLKEQRTTMQMEIDRLNEKLLKAKGEDKSELGDLRNRLSAKEKESEKLRRELALKADELESTNERMREELRKKDEELCKALSSSPAQGVSPKKSIPNEVPKEGTAQSERRKRPTEAGGDSDEDEEQSVEDEEVRSADGGEKAVASKSDDKRENEMLKQQLDNLAHVNDEKDELIQRLQQEILQRGREYQEIVSLRGDEPPRTDRSHSIATGVDHLTMCQKAARFRHSLAAQMSERKEKREELAKVASVRASYYTGRESKTTRESPASTAGWMSAARPKSPPLISRLRDRTPSKEGRKYYQDSTPTPSSSSRHRSLLSPPTDLDSRRISSPSRQLYSFTKSDKRPAWKF